MHWIRDMSGRDNVPGRGDMFRDNDLQRWNHVPRSGNLRRRGAHLHWPSELFGKRHMHRIGELRWNLDLRWHDNLCEWDDLCGSVDVCGFGDLYRNLHLSEWSHLRRSGDLSGDCHLYGDDNVLQWSHLLGADHLSGDGHVHGIDDLWCDNVCRKCHLSG